MEKAKHKISTGFILFLAVIAIAVSIWASKIILSWPIDYDTAQADKDYFQRELN